MQRFLLPLLIAVRLIFAVDFDCVFVGSSPIPLFESLYQRQLGKSVLILEQAGVCGGAWKAIDICGLPHVDLGCHQIGSDICLKEFLETYGGCQLVSLPPENDFYFAQGCYELIRNLTHLLEATGVQLWLNHRLSSAYVDFAADHVVIKTEGKEITASKIFYTQMASFSIENSPAHPPQSTAKYPHLYLLIQDPTPPRFSYMNYGSLGASRAMNLTSFVGLENTGRQLVVFQLHGEEMFDKGQQLIDDLKQRNLLDPSAYILAAEPYTYELNSGTRPNISPQLQPYFEMINASSFGCMSGYLQKWKKILHPYREIIR